MLSAYDDRCSRPYMDSKEVGLVWPAGEITTHRESFANHDFRPLHQEVVDFDNILVAKADAAA